MSTTPSIPLPLDTRNASGAPPSPQPMPNAAPSTPPMKPAAASPVPVAPAAPIEHVQKAVAKAKQTLTQAATSLPGMVGQVAGQKKQHQDLQMKNVLSTVVTAHIAASAAQDKAQQLKGVAEQIDEQMKAAQALPDSDPQKIGKIGYLAHTHQAVVQEMAKQAQTMQQHTQMVQALLADPKNTKIVAKAVGYDEKSANTPERQMLVGMLQQQAQGIDQGGQAALAKAQQQSMPVPDQGQQGAPQSPASGGEPPAPEKRHGWSEFGHVMGEIGEGIAPGIAERVQAAKDWGAGVPQEQRRLAMEAEQAKTAAIEPWQAKHQEAEDKIVGTLQAAMEKANTPEKKTFDYLTTQKGLNPADALAVIYQDKAAGKMGAAHLYTDPATNKQFYGIVAPGKGVVNPATGQAVEGATPYQKPTAQNMFSMWMAQHPGKTVDDYMRLQNSMRPEFPRIVPVNDAQGNVVGYNLFSGTGGGVRTQYISGQKIAGMPQNLGGSPGVIPPKPTAAVLTQSQRAEMIQPQVQALVSQVDKTASHLGPLKGRWNEVMTGKVGANNPDVAKLQMQMKAFVTAFMLSHGLKGEGYEKGLEEYLNTAQSPDNLKARIAGADAYIQDYARATGHGPGTGGGTGGATSGNPVATTTRPDGPYKMNGQWYIVRGGKVYANH